MDTDINAVIWEKQPAVHKPVLIAAFQGWNDGGQSATGAVSWLMEFTRAERFASIDPENFYIFSEHRPTVSLVEGKTRHIEWQKNEFCAGTLPEGGDVILLKGVEPDLLWRTFSANILAVARYLEVRQVVVLGAYLADVLYSLPVEINGFSSETALGEKQDIKPSNYEGPTGIVGVLTDVCGMEGLPTLSLWAAIPYYISIPNPKGVRALLNRLQKILGFGLDMSALDQETEVFEKEINKVVKNDPNVAAYVRELKKRSIIN
ncbi:MAG: PAC2 family protein [Deltaproteobacteria bacterium]|nr:PAC2 family protein [Deltaproteobacteria bacterium]